MNLRNGHFLKLLDFSPTELEGLVEATLTLRRLRACSQDRPTLQGRHFALLFGGRSGVQERWTVQAACARQGATFSVHGPGETGLEDWESVGWHAQHLGRLFDGLVLHGFEQEVVEEVARRAGIPVCNIGSTEFYPSAILADFATMKQHAPKPFSELSLVMLGDGRTNLTRSVLVGAAKLGLDLRLCTPDKMQADENLVETCLTLASETGGQIRLYDDPEEAVKGTDYVYTQTWSGDKKEAKKLLNFRATSDLLSLSGGGVCRLLHRLPKPTTGPVAEHFELDGLEVSRELFESAANLAFEQAENHLFSVEAALISLL